MKAEAWITFVNLNGRWEVLVWSKPTPDFHDGKVYKLTLSVPESIAKTMTPMNPIEGEVTVCSECGRSLSPSTTPSTLTSLASQRITG